MAQPDDAPARRRSALAAAAVAAAGVAVVAIALGVAFAVGSGSPRRHPPRAARRHTAAPAVTQHMTPAARPPALPPPRGEQFGMNVNRLFNGARYSSAQIDAQLHALSATGATLARSDALWEATEPLPPAGGVHHYDWRLDDEIAGSLAAAGLEWLPIVDYSAPWARSTSGQEHSPPSSPSDYAGFAAALAARYGPGGSFWVTHPGVTPKPVTTFEIWNEPDNPSFWRPRPDAASYTELYVRARDAIAVADPTARVIVGGLTHPASFLPKMLAARPSLRGHLDGVAIHPYGADPAAVLAGIRTARGTTRSLGLDDVPLYVTEFGWTTRPAGTLDVTPAALRPGYIARTIDAAGHAGCGIAALLLYTWVTPERDPRDSQDWFGIQPPSGRSGADVAAFAQGLRAAHRPGPRAAAC